MRPTAKGYGGLTWKRFRSFFSPPIIEILSSDKRQPRFYKAVSSQLRLPVLGASTDDEPLGRLNVVTDRLRSHGAALNGLGRSDYREMRRWLNNRAENAQLPFRRRETAMLRFRRMRTLQKFASDHASVHNHFPTECHLQNRETYKQTRAVALAKWRGLLTA